MQKRHQLDFQENLHAQNYELMVERSGEMLQMNSSQGKRTKGKGDEKNRSLGVLTVRHP